MEVNERNRAIDKIAWKMEVNERNRAIHIPKEGIPTNLKRALSTSNHKDTRYAWVVCVAAFLTYFMTTGFSYSIGIYFVILWDVFQEDSSTTSWVSSLNFGVLCMIGMIKIV